MGIASKIYGLARSANVTEFVARSEWRRKRLLILCYHGISALDEHEWCSALYVTQDLLRSRFEWLRSHEYSILPLADALRELRLGTLPPKSVSVTFDDGFTDFFDRALPVIEEYRVPVMLYFATYYSGTGYPVFDPALSYLLWKGRFCGSDLADIAKAGGSSLRVSDAAERSRTVDAFQNIARTRQLDARGKNELLRDIATRLGIDYDKFSRSGLLQLMSSEQIRKLPANLVTLELHTHRHRTPRDHTAFRQELVDNQAALAVLTFNPSKRRHFCYPSGDYDKRFGPWLAEYGVQSATMCVPGLATPKSNPYYLPRLLDTMDVPSSAFEAWATGFADMLPRRGGNRIDPSRMSQEPFAQSPSTTA